VPLFLIPHQHPPDPPLYPTLLPPRREQDDDGCHRYAAFIDPFHNSAVAPALGARVLKIERVFSRKLSEKCGGQEILEGGYYLARSLRLLPQLLDYSCLVSQPLTNNGLIRLHTPHDSPCRERPHAAGAPQPVHAHTPAGGDSDSCGPQGALGHPEAAGVRQ
jgi:hypothetical protein